jgi:hypothetical protein
MEVSEAAKGVEATERPIVGISQPPVQGAGGLLTWVRGGMPGTRNPSDSEPVTGGSGLLAVVSQNYYDDHPGQVTATRKMI